MRHQIIALLSMALLGCGGIIPIGPGVDTDVGHAALDGGNARDAGSDSPDAGGDDCPDEPIRPGAPDTPCQSWQCEQAPAPTCWTCELVNRADGTACPTENGEQGTCNDGRCEAGEEPIGGDPREAGPFDVNRSEASVEIVSGRRPVQATTAIYLPDNPVPVPVIVLLHGFRLDIGLYDSYGRHLASHGFAVIMPQYPNGLIGGANHREMAEYTVAVLNWLESEARHGDLAGLVDAESIGLAGHSLGGKIAMLTASGDDRPDAVFGIDPVDAAGGPLTSDGEEYPSVTPQLMPRLELPIGLVGETTNATCNGFACQACAPEAENFQQYYEHAVGPVVELEMHGANHMSFLDNPNCGITCSVCPAGDDDPATTRRITQGAMTAFFRMTLDGDRASRHHLSIEGLGEAIAQGLVSLRSKNGF